ncbi:response regulator [Chitinimonas sp. BJYL2]|uniref:response regulator n=1 Tax=Chitinimonas sp. BJYL2 TaxID=2976696 RepID=UPI0022B3054C|nr:response regulator [Chitinimonas sp. BJYL2]
MDKSPHILIADDYHQMRLAVQHVLSEMQLHNVHVATHGAEARQMLETVPVSLIIADWNMPGMNGYDLLCWCRNDPHYKDIPFILLTAESGRESLKQAIDAGVSDYLVKPFTAATLRSRVLRQLAPQSQMRQRAVMPTTPASAEVPVLGLDVPLDTRTLRATVLVVDDVPTNIEVMAGVLKQDYAIKVATNGPKALEVARGAQPPDIILLDVMMPDMDGYEVCRQLKADRRTRDIPVIFLTAKDQTDDMVDGFALGAVDYVVKPAQPEVMRARINTHLRLNQALHELRRQNQVLADNARLRDDIERITHHDLRNPIAAVAQTAELMQLDAELQPQQRERLQLMEGAANHALDLINLSLTLYKIEQGDYQAETRATDLGKLLETVIEEIRLQFAWKPVDIQSECPVPQQALAEAALLRSVFANLLKNAVEASPDDGLVKVAVLRVAGECVVQVVNRGAVPLAIRPRFFDKYATHGKADGTGLGTYSARLLTEAQGGRLEMDCNDTLDETRLTLFLPAA